MKVPDLSHLQFLVLGVVIAEPRSGRQIRAQLKRYRVRQSGPAFYQMMARLEAGEQVEGWYEQREVEGQTIKERHYRITARGTRAWRECRGFYERVIEQAGDEGLAHA